MRKPWTPSQLRKLRAMYPHKRSDAVAQAVRRPLYSVYNKALALGIRKTAAYLASPDACRLRRGKHVGEAFQFKKGQQAWNKGKSYTPGGRCREGWFDKGHLPHNHVPVGTKAKVDGYWKVKIGEPKEWLWLHRMNWEKKHGPIPKGAAIIFKDGNHDNCRAGNLQLLTRADLMRRNSYHRYPKDIALAIQLRGALQRQINKREGKREQHNQRSS